MRIVERAGLKLRSILHKSDPWDCQKYSDPKCLICTNPYNKKFNCSKRNIVYKSVCLTCKAENNGKEELEKEMDKEDNIEKEHVKKDATENAYFGESHLSGRE